MNPGVRSIRNLSSGRASTRYLMLEFFTNQKTDLTSQKSISTISCFAMVCHSHVRQRQRVSQVQSAADSAIKSNFFEKLLWRKGSPGSWGESSIIKLR